MESCGKLDFVSQMRTVFGLCDPHGSGYISVASFLDLGQSYLGTHGQDIENLLLLLDPGGKGFLNFEDFCRGILACMRGDCARGCLRSPTVYMDSPDSGFSGFVVGGEGSDDHEIEMSEDNRLSPDSAIVVAPPTSESGSGSPDFARKIISLSDGEEKFECYGEGVEGDRDYDEDQDPPSASSTPTTATRNQHNNNNNNRNGKGAQNFQKRTTWLRTSLRRSPSERRRVSSNALASQLYRSSSFNSSSRNSSSGESDDMHQDLSLEDDVLDLNQKVQMLQQQVSALANTQNTSDGKYGRVKQENAALTAKVHMLEEQLRELEMRSEDRLKEEQQRFKELLARHERERSLDTETYTLKLQAFEKENGDLREELYRQRALGERLKQEKSSSQEQLAESEYRLGTLREERRKAQEAAKRERECLERERAGGARLLEELTREMQEMRRGRSAGMMTIMMGGGMDAAEATEAPPSRLRDLEEQIRILKEENRDIREANEELQAQLLNSSIAEGRSLLHCGEGTSLAAEFEAMSKDEVMEALKEQRDVNTKLRAYIDGILLNILDSYPSILEVKGKHDCLQPPPK